MKLLPLSFNFQVSLRGAGRLHNPVSRGMEEGKTTEGSTGVLPDDSRCFWDSALVRSGLAPVLNESRNAPARRFLDGGDLRTEAVYGHRQCKLTSRRLLLHLPAFKGSWGWV